MSMLQLYWIAHWRRKRDQKQMRGLGEMLGVIWSADTYKRTDPTKSTKRVQEVFIPLATLLNGEQLYKTLDKLLDTNPGAGSTKDPNKVDMSTLSVNAYRKLFEEAPKPTREGGLIPVTPQAHGQAPQAQAQAQAQVQETVKATPSEQPKIDIERIRSVDPELARHLEADASW